MTTQDNQPQNLEQSPDFVIGGALRVLNVLETENVIERYAIGGSVALLYYIEPILTEDMDIFCHIPQTGLIVSLAPVYARLEEMGYQTEGQYMRIEGVLVQFLLPPGPLVEEALENAVEIEVETVLTRIFEYEYLLSAMAEANRPKDRAKILVALESAPPDTAKLNDILARHKLLDRWGKIIA